MSAWIVSSGHIDVLTNGLVQYGILPADLSTITATGQELWRENHRSVNARYGERTRTPSYRPRLVESDLDPRAILTAVGCYDYQSCEHGAWETSRAFRLTGELRAAVEARHPGAGSAPRPRHGAVSWFRWGYERVEEAVQSAAGDAGEHDGQDGRACGACGAEVGEGCRPMCLGRAERDRVLEDAAGDADDRP